MAYNRLPGLTYGNHSGVEGPYLLTTADVGHGYSDVGQRMLRMLESCFMRIALGADHAGFELKEKIKQHLISSGIQVQDEGTNSGDSVDYPDFARLVGADVVEKRADLGILVCGTGIGMSMSANKVAGIRAANVSSEFEAQMAREHNDANVLTLGARVLDESEAAKIIDKWLHTTFAGGRHQRRVDKIMQIERTDHHD